jgi:segregation and condensation protein B
MKDIYQTKQSYSLTLILESLLFTSSSPVSISQMVTATGESEKKVREAIQNLSRHYSDSHGLVLQWHKNRVQIATHPDLSPVIEAFLGIEVTTTLSQAALETLAIIAYKQPITRPEIDEIRGVNSDGVVRNILSKGLIEEVGRVDGMGRPILYGTTEDFLGHFGLNSLSDLPAFDVLPAQQKNGNILKD